MALALLSGARATTGPSIIEPSVASWSFIALATIVALVNFHLSWVRPVLYSRRHHGSPEGYKFISGIPLVGTVLSTIGVLTSWGAWPVAAASLALLLIDTGGALYLQVVLVKDRALWKHSHDA